MKIKEQYHPIGGKDYLSLQHVERYRFALQYLNPGMKALDIACGSGYGSAMIKQAGCEVVGGDYDEDIIDYDRKTWEGIQFEKTDALNLPFDDESFDAVVSFETIEHVHDGQHFLSEMRRVLKPKGIFICSTPNIHYAGHPPFHVHEYESEEFISAVRKRFSNVEVWAQYFKQMDRMRDLFNWHVLPIILRPLIRILEMARLKQGIKQVLKRYVGNNQNQEPQIITGRQIDDLVFGRDNVNSYRVIPMNDERLLRIMLVVARKTE